MSNKSTRRYRKGTYRKIKGGKTRRYKNKSLRKKRTKMQAKIVKIPNTNNTILIFNGVPKATVKKVVKKINGNKQTGGVGGPLGMATNALSAVYAYGGGMFTSLVVGASIATILAAMNSTKINIIDDYDAIYKKNQTRATCTLKDEVTGKCLSPMVGTTQQRRMERSQAEIERKDKLSIDKERAGNPALAMAGIMSPGLVPGAAAAAGVGGVGGLSASRSG